MTPTNYQKLLVAAQDFFKQQLLAKGAHAAVLCPKGYTTNLNGIPALTKSMTTKQQNMQNTGKIDMQSPLNALVPKNKMLEGVKFLFSFVSCPQFFVQPLLQITFHATLRTCVGLCCRGEECRFQRLATMFTRDVSIGPPGTHSTALCFIGNQGKQNRSGRISISAVIPHWNNLLCPIVAIAMMLIYRFVIHGEEFPRVTEYETLFGSFIFRSAGSAAIAASYDTMSGCFTAFFGYLRVVVCAVTHYGRHEGISTMGEEGVSEPSIDQHCNIYSNVAKATYRHNLKSDAMLACAGGNPRDKDGPRPPQGTASVLDSISDETVALLLPCIKLEKARLDEANELLYADGQSFAEARKEKERKCLFSAEGFIYAILFMLRVLIAAAAARPRDQFGRIVIDSLPLHLLFPHNPVFRLPFFRSEQFNAVCTIVRTEEELELARQTRGITSGSAATETASSFQIEQFQRQLSVVEEKVTRIADFQSSVMAPFISAITLAKGASFSFSATPQVDVGVGAGPCGPLAADSVVPVADPGRNVIVLPPNRLRVPSRSMHAVGEQCIMKDFGQTLSIKDFHNEFFVGINGAPSLKSREEGGKQWRDFKSAKLVWSKKLKVANYLRGLISLHGEATAMQLAQAKLESIPKRGLSKAPNWDAFISEICPPMKRQKRADVDSLSDDDGEEIAVMRRDGTRVEEPENPVDMHVNMARATGI